MFEFLIVISVLFFLMNIVFIAITKTKSTKINKKYRDIEKSFSEAKTKYHENYNMFKKSIDKGERVIISGRYVCITAGENKFQVGDKLTNKTITLDMTESNFARIVEYGF